ncbi:hypothetical protein [Actinoplanes sp. NPDC089786]|uniref:hypothetical protein n=1 Tax=Actinoplanes sp. NPDC089786 TaxID=3155185 RepID=UPI00342B1504
MGTAEGDGYGDAMPQVRDHVAKFKTVLGRVRTTHRGRPQSEVLSALEAEAAAEGIEVWREVAEEAARLISNSEFEA